MTIDEKYKDWVEFIRRNRASLNKAYKWEYNENFSNYQERFKKQVLDEFNIEVTDENLDECIDKIVVSRMKLSTTWADFVKVREEYIEKHKE